MYKGISREQKIANGWHVLSNIDLVNRVGICSVCGIAKLHGKGKNKLVCANKTATKERINKHQRFWNPDRNLVKDKCERCGFVPEDIEQLDVHHIGGRGNSEVQTLCANCHRLITKRTREKRWYDYKQSWTKKYLDNVIATKFI